MLKAEEVFKKVNQEGEDAVTRLNNFADDNNLEIGDYVGTLDYMCLTDSERINAIDFTINHANDSDENINMEECDSIENLFYREIDIMSEELGTCLNSYAYDFIGISKAITETNAAYQREISERSMYELANKKSEICDKLSDIVTILDSCLNYKDKE